MKFTTYLQVLAVFLVFFGFGCSKRVRIPVEQPVCIANGDVEGVMESCSSALKKFGFIIEKYDVDVGYIRTRPLRGGQLFEFWRRDNVGRENIKDSSIHSIRRVAEVQLRQDAGKICVECVVNVWRLGMENDEPLSWSEVQHMYTGGSESLSPTIEDEKTYWIEMGEDELLESELLRELK